MLGRSEDDLVPTFAPVDASASSCEEKEKTAVLISNDASEGAEDIGLVERDAIVAFSTHAVLQQMGMWSERLASIQPSASTPKSTALQDDLSSLQLVTSIAKGLASLSTALKTLEN